MSSILKCHACSVKFEPNRRQLGQAMRGRHLYCSPECCETGRRDKMREWWVSDVGRKYARDRARYYREHPDEKPKPRKKRLKRNYRRTNKEARR